MSVLWADNFQMYGRNTAPMLNGIYSDVTSFCSLVPDPDPSGSGEIVLKMIPDVKTSFPYADARLAFPVPGASKTTIGASVRMWMTSLPVSDNASVRPLMFIDTTGARHLWLMVRSDGRLSIGFGTPQNGSLDPSKIIATSTLPVLTANAWQHIEFKATVDNVTGATEVRVDGIEVAGLTLTDTDTANGGTPNIGSVGIEGYEYLVTAPLMYLRDFIVWDTTGSQNNDFLGTLHVYNLLPDGDTALNWDTSSGSTGFNLISDTAPSNQLTSTGAIATGEKVVIGSTTYQWTSGSVDAGTPAGTSGSPWLVALGGSAAESMGNLFLAIGATGTAGTSYSTALTAHPTVSVAGVSATQLNIEATDGITSNITCTETGANLAWTATTLTSGITDLSYVSADDTLPAASEFSMTDLPPDIVSVKALIPITRSRKVDGGDGQLQTGLISNLATDLGADRTITSAFTYWWDVSEVSPDTAVSYTPTEVNNITFLIDRTV